MSVVETRSAGMSLDDLVEWLGRQSSAAWLRDPDREVCKRAADAIAALRRDAERMKTALMTFGQHGEYCPANPIDPMGECDCGFAEVIDAAIAGCKTSDSKDDTLAVRHDAAAHDAAERVELGCAGHLICADSCRWRRHTQVGKYRVSTVGDYFPDRGGKRHTLGAGDKSFFETMVFPTESGQEAGNEGCGCCAVLSYDGLEQARYATAGEAQAGHEAMVAKYAALSADATTGSSRQSSQQTGNGADLEPKRAP